MKPIFWYHLIITIIFTYIFVQFLTLKRSNLVFKIYADYILNKYCLALYIIISLFIMKYDTYTGILLLILIIAPFKLSFNELFITNEKTNNNDDIYNDDIPTVIKDGLIVADIPKPTATFLQATQDANLEFSEEELIALCRSDIFNINKADEVKIKEILRQIKSQVDFDPYKTNLSKETIYEIYNKYFDNDIFKKLKNINDDSKTYLASGNFEYVPTVPQVDYDITTYQNLSNNIQFGINPLADGLSNKTKINRG